MNKSLSGLKTLFLIHFVVGLIFGLIYPLFPGPFLAAMKWPAPDVMPYRTIGAAILAFTASSWLCYKEFAWDKVKIVVQAEIVWTGLATLLHLYFVLFLGAPAAGWINVLLMGFFAIAFFYYYRKGLLLIADQSLRLTIMQLGRSDRAMLRGAARPIWRYRPDLSNNIPTGMAIVTRRGLERG